MKGGKNRQPLGYTIIEVMIVLAISGVMFLIAVQFINGKQQNSAFLSAVNIMSSQIQDVIEQVSDGKFSDIPLGCTVNVSGNVVITPTASQTQGTNPDCVFVGKFLHFNVLGNKKKYEFLTVAAPRQVADLTKAVPVFDAPGGVSDLTTHEITPQGLDVIKIVQNADLRHATGAAIYGFGIVQGQGTIVENPSPSSTQVGYAGGGQLVSLVYAPGLISNTDESGVKSSMSSGLGLVATPSIDICMSDGARYAWIQIGGNDTNDNKQSQLTVSVQQLGSSACQ